MLTSKFVWLSLACVVYEVTGFFVLPKNNYKNQFTLIFVSIMIIIYQGEVSLVLLTEVIFIVNSISYFSYSYRYLSYYLTVQLVFRNNWLLIPIREHHLFYLIFYINSKLVNYLRVYWHIYFYQKSVICSVYFKINWKNIRIINS